MGVQREGQGGSRVVWWWQVRLGAGKGVNGVCGVWGRRLCVCVCHLSLVSRGGLSASRGGLSSSVSSSLLELTPDEKFCPTPLCSTPLRPPVCTPPPRSPLGSPLCSTPLSPSSLCFPESAGGSPGSAPPPGRGCPPPPPHGELCEPSRQGRPATHRRRPAAAARAGSRAARGKTKKGGASTTDSGEMDS